MKLSRTYAFLLVCLIGCIPLVDLLRPGLPITHDNVDHVARIANFYQNIQQGNGIPRWAGNLNWGYGHPILMFLYPLPSYIASFFIFLGFNLVQSVKLVYALAFVVSGAAMYSWIARMVSVRAGMLAALLYMFAPYRFVDLYVRGALGEHVFFIWPPLICGGIYSFFKKPSAASFAGISLATAGMLLSHNALSIMVLPFIVAYAIVLARFVFRDFITFAFVSLSGTIGVLLSAFFLIPAFFEGKYTLRDIVTSEDIFTRFEPVTRLLYSPWDYGGTGNLSVHIGFVHTIAIISALLLGLRLVKIKSVKWNITIRLLVLTCLFGVLSLFFIVEQSALLYAWIPTLQKFQFPWRWLSLTVFTTSISGGLLAHYFKEKLSNIHIMLIASAIIFPTMMMWQAKEYEMYDDSYFYSVYRGTTDTGESAPIWSVRFMLEEPEEPLEYIEGSGTYTLTKYDQDMHAYDITVESESARIKENTLYFPGWEVSLNGEAYHVHNLEWQDPNHRGIMTFDVPQGRHTLSLSFGNTLLRTAAEMTSLVSLILLLLCIKTFKTLLRHAYAYF